MKLLTILPIARGIRTEMLTYFSSEDIAVGTVVSIPIRKKTCPGIIIESKNALEVKSEIKDMPFSVKKIVRHKDDVALPFWLMDAAKNIEKESISSVGAIIAAILPKIALENPEAIFKDNNQKTDKLSGFDILAIQATNADRYDIMRSIIRESFAKKMSVAIICPTEESASLISTSLSKGIEQYSLLFSSIRSKKLLSKWSAATSNTSHPMLLVGSSAMLGLLPTGVGTIILEEESSPFYKQRRRPFLDIRHSAIEIARSMGSRIIFADKLLSIETQAKIREGKTHEYARLSKRSFHKIQTLLVDMKPKDEEEKKEFKIISPELDEMLRFAEKLKKKIFIYSARRGISAQTICRDCGTTVFCDRCEAPVVLHTQSGEKKFICHHCGASRSALEQCKACQSWNLFSYGVGIERIEEEIKRIVSTEVVRIDGDTTNTAKEVKVKIDKFLSGKNGVLIGTDFALRFLPDLFVSFAAIPTLDSLTSLPDFRTSERMMHTILDIKAKATECMLLQGRDTESKIVEHALSGDLETFAKDEIKARKEFGYPPFTKIVKLTVAGKKDVVKVDAQMVASKLAKYKPAIFPAFIKAIKGETLLHIMIKIPAKEWPDKELTEILLSFPPSVRIDTSPQSLL